MWARLCIGLLVLAMVASGTTVSHAHLHTGNGHRVAHDDDHAGSPAQSLWHSHGAPHAHDADVHAHEPASVPGDHGGHERPEAPVAPEDVVSVGGTVASAPTSAYQAPPVLVAIIVAGYTRDVPVGAWTSTVAALPRVHAPPLIAPRSPRAPPTFAPLHV